MVLFIFQKAFLKSKTCELVIAHSTNVNCTGTGRYLHRGMQIMTKCEQGYFVTGSRKVTCKSTDSRCEACACNPDGSESIQCDDGTGHCNVK